MRFTPTRAVFGSIVLASGLTAACLLPDTSTLVSLGAVDASTKVDASGDAASIGDGGADGPSSLDPSLIGWWTFEEPDGSTVVDRTGHGNDATLSGTPSRVAGKVGQAIKFTLDDQTMVVKSLSGAKFPQSEGTLAMWIKVDANETGQRGYFDGYETFRAHMWLRTYGTSEYQFTAQSSTQNGVASVVLPMVRGTFQHVVLVWFGGRIRLHVDDTSNDYTYGESWAPTNQSFDICETCRGTVDEVRLYDRALSVTEVAALP